MTVFDGPVALAARDGSIEHLRLGDLDAARPLGRPHHYELGPVRLAPLYEADDEPYHLYLREAASSG